MIKIKKAFKFILLTSVLILTLFISCAKEVKYQPDPDTEYDTGRLHEEGIRLEYLKEGFIDSSTYRVVIIATKEECVNDEASIRRKGETRIIASLRKYLISQGEAVDHNTRSGLLNMTGRYGRFYRPDGKSECEETNIYYYEIHKERVRESIHSLGARR